MLRGWFPRDSKHPIRSLLSRTTQTRWRGGPTATRSSNINCALPCGVLAALASRGHGKGLANIGIRVPLAARLHKSLLPVGSRAFARDRQIGDRQARGHGRYVRGGSKPQWREHWSPLLYEPGRDAVLLFSLECPKTPRGGEFAVAAHLKKNASRETTAWWPKGGYVPGSFCCARRELLRRVQGVAARRPHGRSTRAPHTNSRAARGARPGTPTEKRRGRAKYNVERHVKT